MKVETLFFTEDRGWSAPFPKLDSPRTVVLVFGFSALAEDRRLAGTLDPLYAAYPSSHVVGCSTAGEIIGSVVRDDSIAVAVVRFDATAVRTASAIIATPADCAPAGRAVAEELAAPDLASIFVLSDGLNVNGTDLLRGLNERLHPGVVVTGGLAGDGARFQRTWVLERRQPRRHRVVGLGLYGKCVRVAHGSRGGWDIFGPERRVTRSDGNVLFEVDGRPALRLYKEYLGDQAAGLPATALLFPLSLRRHDSTEPIVRTILSVDEPTQSMTFAGDIPQGSQVQFMRADFNRLIEGANQAARLTGTGSDAPTASLAVAISCVGRRLVLGKRSLEEIAAVTDVLPRSSALVGFYSYGEMSPHDSGRCELHNQTMTLTRISEG